MSRIGKQPVSVPSGVTVEVNETSNSINVSGPKGKLSYTWHEMINVKQEDKDLVCSVREGLDANRTARAQWGTTRSRIQNTAVLGDDQLDLDLVVDGLLTNLQSATLAVENDRKRVYVRIDRPDVATIQLDGRDIEKLGQLLEQGVTLIAEGVGAAGSTCRANDLLVDRFDLLQQIVCRR